MTPVRRALWFIESHFTSEITLDDVANACGVSRHHLARIFTAGAGRSVMRYVRGRRLTQAARELADGAPDILQVALTAGYGSHEAFTRAFRDEFGVTPESVRAMRHIKHLTLVEPQRMTDDARIQLDAPRFIDGKPLLIVGLSERVNQQKTAGIPALWQRFHQHDGHISGQIGGVAYGVCHNCDDEGDFDYMAGVEVRDFSDLPPELARLRIPAQRYAVFTHRGHISSIPGVWRAIMEDWLPQSGHAMADAPDFERYDDRFDPRSGLGGFEIWIPIAK